GAAIDPRARDVAAYLSTLGNRAPEDAAAPGADTNSGADTLSGAEIIAGADIIAGGGRLFASLDCIACHTLPDRPPDAAIDAQRVPLRWVKSKYKPAALVNFLRQPEKHYSWTRMPNFRLSESEARALAGYLISAAPPEPSTATAPAEGNIGRGRQLVSSSGCLNCHTIGNETSTLKVPSLAEIPAVNWNRGCMSAVPAPGNAPDFHLSTEQRNAILAFAATDRTSLSRESPPEFAERQIVAARCIACHTRDDEPSVLSS